MRGKAGGILIFPFSSRLVPTLTRPCDKIPKEVSDKRRERAVPTNDVQRAIVR